MCIDRTNGEGCYSLLSLFLCLLPFLVKSQTLTSVTTLKATGEMKQWHKLTFTFSGPATDEAATPSPFSYYRLTINLTHIGASGDRTYTVPGYFAADGNAANTRATGGNKWRCHFTPPHVGRWRYSVSFRRGKNIILDPTLPGKSAGYMDGYEGEFAVKPSDKTGKDGRAKGLLQYVGKRYLWLAGSEEYFLKIGTDSPENLLAYEDFDNTPNHLDLRKQYKSHTKDWRKGDPTWNGAKGKALIGAINYLASKGLNMMSFLTFNVQGDDGNVFPYTSEYSFRIDVSKTDQWEIALEHAAQKGIGLHVKTQETENEFIHGNKHFIVRRAIYYRELVARFGHHPQLVWNLGEETKMPTSLLLAAADYIRSVDPYDHPIDVHTYPNAKAKVYPGLIRSDTSKVTGASLQCEFPERINAEVAKWIAKSARSPNPLVVSNDEQGPNWLGVGIDSLDPAHDSFRRNALWGTLMAGGAGVEFYFGWGFRRHQTGNKDPIIGNDDTDTSHPYSTCSDLTCEDFRSRDKLFTQAFVAWRFMKDNHIPFWEMTSSNHLTEQKDDFVFAKEGDIYLVYTFTNTTTVELTVVGKTTYSIQYWNPKTGGDLTYGGVVMADLIDGEISRKMSIPVPEASRIGSSDVLMVVRKANWRSGGPTSTRKIVNGAGV
mmetsp:Transcript_42547/g.120718  ORF Transcript_42547/g.120718 Transcript_42547/m.120718 type:complete len:658 (-) Transcript_42547:1479-3452(-)